MSNSEPKIVCFSCKFGWGYLGSEAALSSQVKNWIPIICSGKIDAQYILDAFRQGADGVLVLGCPEGDCHFQDGNVESKKRIYLLQKVLEAYGIEPERVRIELSLDPEGKKIPELVKKMSGTVKKLGPMKVLASR
ncbi:MAG TPA: hydrogenase iron-sulfur subunit [Dehalococcoidia bacterium]|nr:hydrogenase iron-sulfur subunit [Dehalococcoidia bacterium]